MVFQRVIAATALFISAAGWAAETRAIENTTAPAEFMFLGVDMWHEAQGLPQSRVRQVVQTRDGYLWLGTDGGLLRFDGNKFTGFNVRTASLVDNEVLAMKEGPDGTLWIGTISGGLTSYRDGLFRTYTKTEGLPDNVVRTIDFDRQGNLWVATNRGVARFDGNTFTLYGKPEGLVHDLITTLCASSTEGIFAVADDVVHRFVDGRFVPDRSVAPPGEGRQIALASTRDGALWVYQEQAGVRRLKDGHLTDYRVASGSKARRGIFCEDDTGGLWLATRDGLRQERNGTFELVLPHGWNEKLGPILSIADDREDSIWLGLEANGLARVRRTPAGTLASDDPLAESSLRCVIQDRHGDIWFGGATGIGRLHEGRLSTYTTLDGTALPFVNSLCEDDDGTLWVAAGGELLALRDGVLRREPDWQRVAEIKTIFRDSGNRLWITTDGDGLFVREDNRFRQLRRRDGLSSDHLRGVASDRTGAIWIASFGAGVNRYADGRFTNFTTVDGLAHNHVVTVFASSDGSVWFGTRRGLSRYRDGQFTSFTTRDGLFVNFVSAIGEDAERNLWFSCDQGIFGVSLDDFDARAANRIARVRSRSYGTRDGLATLAFMAGQQPSFCRTTDGRLLFPSLKGLTSISPAQNVPNAQPPPVHIERVMVNGLDLPKGAVEATAGSGRVEIHYTALSFIAPEKIRFRYRLTGVDPDWVEAGDRRFAYYANLSPGTYDFEVTACNNDGVWSARGASLHFRLPPRFFETGWFRGLVVLGFVGALFGGYRWRIRQLVARERELQARIGEAVANIKVLSGMLPICSSCKKVRDDRGYWDRIENYIQQHSDTRITHGMCPDCVKQLYPDLAVDVSECQPPAARAVEKKPPEPKA